MVGSEATVGKSGHKLWTGVAHRLEVPLELAVYLGQPSLSTQTYSGMDILSQSQALDTVLVWRMTVLVCYYHYV